MKRIHVSYYCPCCDEEKQFLVMYDEGIRASFYEPSEPPHLEAYCTSCRYFYNFESNNYMELVISVEQRLCDLKEKAAELSWEVRNER